MQFLRIISIVALTAVLCVPASNARAERGRRAARQGPWIVYRYPIFRTGNRPPEVRGRSQDYFWPSNVYEQYPRFYGGIHARELQDAGTPPATKRHSA